MGCIWPRDLHYANWKYEDNYPQTSTKTRHLSSIKPWYRVRISTEYFVEVMGLTQATSGEDKLNVWAPVAFFPPAAVPVKQTKLTTARSAACCKNSPNAMEMADVIYISD